MNTEKLVVNMLGKKTMGKVTKAYLKWLNQKRGRTYKSVMLDRQKIKGLELDAVLR